MSGNWQRISSNGQGSGILGANFDLNQFQGCATTGCSTSYSFRVTPVGCTTGVAGPVGVYTTTNNSAAPTCGLNNVPTFTASGNGGVNVNWRACASATSYSVEYACGDMRNNMSGNWRRINTGNNQGGLLSAMFDVNQV